MPSDFVRLAHTRNARFAAIANLDSKFYGVQFHPEVHHTPSGPQILKNFLSNYAHHHARQAAAKKAGVPAAQPA